VSYQPPILKLVSVVIQTPLKINLINESKLLDVFCKYSVQIVMLSVIISFQGIENAHKTIIPLSTLGGKKYSNASLFGTKST
jgi:hypothetical protein